MRPRAAFTRKVSRSFEYSDLAVADHDVSVTVRNAGPRAGAEAVQLYLGPPTPAPLPMVPKSLAGFELVDLQPGQSKRVTIRLGTRELSYWSTERHDWAVAAGERTVFVGGQSTVISGPNAAVTQPLPPNR